MHKRALTSFSLLTLGGCVVLSVAILALLGRYAHVLEDFRISYGWVPLYCVFAFSAAGLGLLAIARGFPLLGHVAGIAVLTQASSLLAGSVGAAPGWLQSLLAEYTGTSQFAQLNSVRTVIICNFSLGLALILMGMRRSFPQKALALAILGALIVALLLSELTAHALNIRISNDIHWPILTATTSTRVFIGAVVIAYALCVAPPQLRVGSVPWLPLILIIGLLTAALLIWRALVSEGEQRLREAIAARVEHVKAELTDGINRRVKPVTTIAHILSAKDIATSEQHRAIVFEYHQGLQAVALLYKTSGSVWHVLGQRSADIRFSSIPPAEFLAKAEARETTTVTVDGTGNLLVIAPIDIRGLHTLVLGVYHAQTLLDQIIHKHALQDIALTISSDFDIYRVADIDVADQWARDSKLELAGDTWSIRIAPSNRFVADMMSPLPWVVLLSGFVLTLALVWMFYLARLATLRVKELAAEVERRQRAERKLQSLNGQLEQRVRQRTQELANEKELLAVTMDSIGDGVVTTDTLGTVRSINKAAQAMTGWKAEEATGKGIATVLSMVEPGSRDTLEVATLSALQERESSAVAHKAILIGKDGHERLIAACASPIRDRKGNILGGVLAFCDITESQRLEEDQFHARNLEAVGLLAGGIAHDFNNILTGITANVSLAKLCARPGDTIHQSLTEVEKAFSRARDLTMQLLTFSRGGAPIRKSASVAELLQDTTGFVLSGSAVKAQIEIAEDLWAACIDPGQISQAINNILINAMQAMPGGGNLFIGARNRRLFANEKPVAAGHYIELTITDQGVGIAPEILARIFEPYFTTKKSGTGLGLATTYSIIKRHRGHIEVESAMERGTTFRVYLPAAQQAKIPASDQKSRAKDLRGNGRVLLMDDDEQIRNVAARSLAVLGYEVVVARDGEEVLARYTEALSTGRRFDAVILDLTIPGGMGGMECQQRLTTLDPDVRSIVSSGYSNDPVLADFVRHGFRAAVVKPYLIDDLAASLHDVLSA